jgi:hypothetical protein
MLLGRMVTFYLSEDKLVGIKGSKMGVIFVCFDIMQPLPVPLSPTLSTNATTAPSSSKLEVACCLSAKQPIQPPLVCTFIWVVSSSNN